MGYTSNIDEIIAALGQTPDKIRRKVGRIVVSTIRRIDTGVHQKTPVWSGKAIRNMIWTKGAPNATEFEEIKVGDVENEGRRPANAGAARQSLDRVVQEAQRKPFGEFWLSNCASHILELEAGKLPSPERSRVPPGGMFGLTYAEVRASIGVGNE